MKSSFLDHLEELRKVLLRCVAGFGVALPVGFAVAPRLIQWLLAWCAPEQMDTFYFFKPLEKFILDLRVGVFVALALSFPWSALKIWGFVLPACTPAERKAFRFWIWFSTALFISGAAFCVLLVLPLIMVFSAGFETENIRPLLGITPFVSLAGTLSFAFGLAFQTPVAVCIAVRFGLVRVEMLKKTRRYAIVFALIFATLLTPPDVLSQILLAVPMYILYELGILLAGFYKRKETGSIDVPSVQPEEDDTMLAFYDSQRDK